MAWSAGLTFFNKRGVCGGGSGGGEGEEGPRWYTYKSVFTK